MYVLYLFKFYKIYILSHSCNARNVTAFNQTTVLLRKYLADTGCFGYVLLTPETNFSRDTELSSFSFYIEVNFNC